MTSAIFSKCLLACLLPLIPPSANEATGRDPVLHSTFSLAGPRQRPEEKPIPGLVADSLFMELPSTFLILQEADKKEQEKSEDETEEDTSGFRERSGGFRLGALIPTSAKEEKLSAIVDYRASLREHSRIR